MATMLAGGPNATVPNVEGQTIWLDNDPSKKLRELFEKLPECWRLRPDQSVFASGGNSDGDVIYLGARHRDGKWVMVYCAAPHKFSVAMNKLASRRVRAYWVDPRTGDSTFDSTYPNSGTQSFATPDGWEDAVLVLVTPEGSKRLDRSDRGK